MPFRYIKRVCYFWKPFRFCSQISLFLGGTFNKAYPVFFYKRWVTLCDFKKIGEFDLIKLPFSLSAVVYLFSYIIHGNLFWFLQIDMVHVVDVFEDPSVEISSVLTECRWKWFLLSLLYYRSLLNVQTMPLENSISFPSWTWWTMAVCHLHGMDGFSVLHSGYKNVFPLSLACCLIVLTGFKRNFFFLTCGHVFTSSLQFWRPTTLSIKSYYVNLLYDDYCHKNLHPSGGCFYALWIIPSICNISTKSMVKSTRNISIKYTYI